MRSNLVGKRFGKLLVLEKTGNLNSYNSPIYKCICDCGKYHFSASNQLNSKSGTRSCGCSRLISKLRKNYGESSFRQLYQTYRKHAIDRRLEFSLNEIEFKSLCDSNCYYCGCSPYQVVKASGRSYGEYVYNGIDRINNSLGYTVDNCVPCCGRCNRAKDTWTKEEFFVWVKQIYEYHDLIIYEETNENCCDSPNA